MPDQEAESIKMTFENVEISIFMTWKTTKKFPSKAPSLFF